MLCGASKTLVYTTMAETGQPITHSSSSSTLVNNNNSSNVQEMVVASLEQRASSFVTGMMSKNKLRNKTIKCHRDVKISCYIPHSICTRLYYSFLTYFKFKLFKCVVLTSLNNVNGST